MLVKTVSNAMDAYYIGFSRNFCLYALFLVFSHPHSLFHFLNGLSMNNHHTWFFKMVSRKTLLYLFICNQRNALTQLVPFKNTPPSCGMLKQTVRLFYLISESASPPVRVRLYTSTLFVSIWKSIKCSTLLYAN